MVNIRSIAAAAAAVLLITTLPLLSSAGTTGAIRGRVVDSTTHVPVAGATVTVASPSQSATATTDSGGNFSFISLAPDTYTVSAQKAGYDPSSLPGYTVLADQSTNVSVSLAPSLKTIAQVRSRSAQSLVHPGTTSDVFSLNASGQKAAYGVAGSGSLNQAYGAIATAPGVSIPSGQQGWYQSVYIRGADYDQVAYEFDGLPVLRESDDAPIITLNSLGQQEVQVYTGGTPATSDSPGLAGYINQVIKTGTYPGYANANFGIGGPTFYHQFSAEIGGASPNHLFSYYLGTEADNQDFRYGNQFNGAGDPLYFFPLYVPTNNSVYHILDGSGFIPGSSGPNGICDGSPQCWGGFFTPGSVNGQAYQEDRETIGNLHFGIPHHHDSGRDDIQLMYTVGQIYTWFNSSANDIGAASVSTCTPDGNFGLVAGDYCNPLTTANFWPGAQIPWLDSTFYNGPLMQTPNNNNLVNGPFPSSPVQRSLNNPTVNGFPTSTFLPTSQRDTSSNAFGIEKFQYQRNINNSSYLRFDAFGEYTDWFIFGGNAAQLTFGASLPDYEVVGHFYGGNLTYANQLSSQHQITAKVSYETQRLQTYNAGFGATGLGTIITSYADKNGNCYNFTTGALWSCFDPGSQGGLSPITSTINLAPATPPPGTPAANAGASWIVTENGHNAQVDNVAPYFSSAAITDVYHPNEKLTVNYGARIDNFAYRLDNLESNYPARQFWFNAFNRENCGAPGLAPVSTFNANTGTFGTCPSGFTPMATSSGAPTPGFGLSNVAGSTTSATEFQPRVAFTYALNPDTVIRGSAGRYARPAATSYQQFNTYQQDLASFISQFYAFGYLTPDHDVRPDTADNFDLSLEKHIRGTNLSYKITPFYRNTQNQLQYLQINPLQGVLAGINVGTQTNYGVELSLQGGDFSRDGLSFLASYTYTNSKVKYQPVANGASVVDTLNAYIEQYNSYTSACNGATNPAAVQPGTALYTQCGGGQWVSSGQAQNAMPTFSITNPNTSATNTISNPYYNNPIQPLLDRNGSYAPYDLTPSPFSGGNGFEVPNVATLILNYRHGRFAVTPTITYDSGSVYGSPLVYPGYVPQSCFDPPSATPMTPGVSCNGSYTTASGTTQTPGAIFLPDPFNGNKFDSPGSLQQPWQLSANLQMSYDLSSNMSITLAANNIYNKCFQRGYAWDDSNTCIYSNLPSNILAPSGNFLALANTPIQVKYPYGTWFNNTQVGYTSELQPFQITLNLNVRM